MNWMLPIFMTFASISGSNKEIDDFLKSSIKASTEEATHFLENQQLPSATEERKCAIMTSPLPEILASKQGGQKIFLFTSLSLPLESWKEYSYFLEKTGGSFVLRGLPKTEPSFTALMKKIMELRKAGIQAGIVLDPESFEKYEITAIPTLVVDNDKQYDKISGNIKPMTSLRYFAENGHTKNAAQKILKQLEAR